MEVVKIMSLLHRLLVCAFFVVFFEFFLFLFSFAPFSPLCGVGSSVVDSCDVGGGGGGKQVH